MSVFTYVRHAVDGIDNGIQHSVSMSWWNGCIFVKIRSNAFKQRDVFVHFAQHALMSSRGNVQLVMLARCVAGGSYIGAASNGDSWVATAAHCTQAGVYQVAFGEHSLSTVDGCEQTCRVTQIIDHPEYNPSTLENDYSLLRVDVTKRLFGGKARPAITLRLADGVGGVRCP